MDVPDRSWGRDAGQLRASPVTAESAGVRGAPRSMKVGNIPSPWRYDVGAFRTLP